MAFDGVRRSPVPPDQLVESGDANIVAYDQRLKALGVTSWLATLYNCQRHDWQVFLAAKELLQAHAARLLASDEPYLRADVDMWIGNYPETPSGVHQDVASNYSVVLLGRKAYDFWPNAAFSPTGIGQYGHATVDPASVAKTSQRPLTIRGNPGDLIFWPRSYWHVAHPSPGPSATMNVGLYRHRSDDEEAQRTMSWIASQVSTAKSAASAIGAGSPLFEGLQSLVEDTVRFGRILVQAREASVLTAGGLDPLPEPDFAYFATATGMTAYHFDPRSDFEFLRRRDHLALVVNGHVFPLPLACTSPCEDLVEELRRVKVIAIDHARRRLYAERHLDTKRASLRFWLFGLLVAAAGFASVKQRSGLRLA